MKVTSVEVSNFRNVTHQSVSFGEGVNLIVGANGQGKTNLVEAVTFLSWLKSFRSPRTADLIRASDGVNGALLSAVVDGRTGVHEIRAEIGRGWRKILIDGAAAASARDTMQMLSVACLSPEDPAILEGGPEGRRILVDRFAAQIEPCRTSIFTTWTRLVRERNAMLRAAGRDSDLMDAIERNMARVGAEYAGIRLDAVGRIAARLPSMLASMTGADLLVRLAVRSRWLGGIVADHCSPEFLAVASEALRSELAARRDSDTILGYTSAGPGVDDVEVCLEGLKARGHASRGQKKVLMLAWKAAEAAEIERLRGEAPVLVLDDALADLDLDRQDGVVRFLRSYPGQSFITSAAVQASLFEGATVIRAAGGKYCRCG